MSQSTSHSEEADTGVIPGQTSITGDGAVTPKPEDNKCGWCPEQALFAYEMMKKIKGGFVGSAMYVFCCGEHRETLLRVYHPVKQVQGPKGEGYDD